VRLTIRWRLTLWITLALGVTLTCFAILVYALLRQALFEQTDRSLQSALGQLKGDPRANTATEERVKYWIEEFKDHLGLYGVVYRNGTPYAWSTELTDKSFPTVPPNGADTWTAEEQLPVIGRQRIMAERMRLGAQEFVVVVLAPLDMVDGQLAQVRNVFFIAGPLTLLLSAVLAFWLAGKVLAPMSELRRSTDAITVEHLDQRLPILNPDDELGQLTNTINAMIGRLERSFAEIRRFTADASHELRTPLTALRAEVEISMAKNLAPEETRQLLGGILEELVRMSRLTDQLLTLSRRDAGVEQMAVVPVALNTLITGVVDALRPLAESRQIRLHLEGEGVATIQIHGDEGRLRQVFINLLDNALKYTPSDGKVVVRIEKQGTTVTVVVEDTGIGIPPEHLPRVFDRFYRVDKARSREEGGTGLGLSIAESIVKAHGGTIKLESTIGKGTVCCVILPNGNGEPLSGRL
jgi:two-component system heavy metal sensor histidine kinase CusS